MSLYDFGGLVVFHTIQYYINTSNARKIANAPTAREAFLLRQRLKYARKGLAITYAVIFAVIYYVITFIDSNGNSDMAAIIALGIFVYCLLMMLISPSYYKAIDGISVYTREEFQKEYPRYALFLRAFYNDEYQENSCSIPLTAEKGKDVPFSEQHFVAELEKKISVCAVGMTKEVEHPIGATRVYVNDEMWQEDVRLLMKQAEMVFILVDYRESCIWEIKQSEEYQEKTKFIVNDINKYNQVRNALKESYELPPIPNALNDAEQLIINFKAGNAHFQKFDNSIASYHHLLHIEEDIDKEIIKDNPYNGFEFITFSDSTIDGERQNSMLEQISMLCITKQSQCPIIMDDIFTLIDCRLKENIIYFIFDVNEVNCDMDVLKEQSEIMKEIAKDDLNENYGEFVQSLRILNYHIMHRYIGKVTKKEVLFEIMFSAI